MTLLIKNECIKLWKQTSVKILLILTCVIIVLLPLLSLAGYALDRLTAFDYDAASMEASALDSVEYAEAADMPIYAAESRAEAAACRFFLDLDDRDSEDWKYERFGDELTELYGKRAVTELLVSGEYTVFDALDEGSYAWDLRRDPDSPLYDMDFYSDVKTPDGYYETVPNEEAWSSITREALQTYLDGLNGRIAALETEISTVTVTLVYDGLIEAVRETCDSATSEVQALQTALERSPDDEALAYALAVQEASLSVNARALEILICMQDEQISIDDWRFTMYDTVLSTAYRNHAEGVVMPEVLYREEPVSAHNSYEMYRETAEQALADSEEVMALAEYSIRNNIPSRYLLDRSAKGVLRDNLASAVSVISVLFLVIASAGIVAQEHTSGTIRLLLIRPKTRTKILASKLLALMTYFVGLVLAALVVQSVLSVLLFGVSDFFTPDLGYMNGSVVELPAILKTLQILGASVLSALFVSSIAFLLSTLTHRNALAIALSLVVVLISSTVQQVAMMVSTMLPFVGYTILPYLDLGMFTSSLFDAQCAMNGMTGISSAFGSFSALVSSYMTDGLYPIWGAIQLVLMTLLCWFFAFLAFNKQQVKS